MVMQFVRKISASHRSHKHSRCRVESLTNSSSTPGNDSSSVFPIDIWQEIIKHLSPATLRDICTVNRNLHWLAQPLLFECIIIHPSYQSKNLARNLGRRLEFLRSQRIAWAIRECRIDLGVFTNTKMFQSISDIILGGFADCASAFPNLRRFTLSSVHITLPILAKLQHYQPLALVLKSCTYASDVYASKDLHIPVKTLRLVDSAPHLEYTEVQKRDYPRFFFWSDHLESMISGKEHGEATLIEIASKSRPCSFLVHLEVPIELSSSEHLISALSLCVNLQVLDLYGRFSHSPHFRDDKSPFPTTFLPNLHTYSGPHQFARRLCLSQKSNPTRVLRCITIRLPSRFTLHSSPSFDLYSDHQCDSLLRTINLFPTSIDDLNFVAISTLGPLLPHIKTAAPQLKRLGINSDPSFYNRCLTPEEFVERLRFTHRNIPTTLEELTIGIQLKDPFKSKGGKLKEMKRKQETNILPEAAFAMISSLKKLRVWYWATPAPRWVTWVKGANGTVDTFWQRSLD